MPNLLRSESRLLVVTTRGIVQVARTIELDHLLVHIYTGSREDSVRVSVTDAKAQLTELVRRAEAGDEVVLTRHGRPVVRLAPVKVPVDREARRRLLEEIMKAAAGKLSPGPSAARSQDFLYDDEGLPR